MALVVHGSGTRSGDLGGKSILDDHSLGGGSSVSGKIGGGVGDGEGTNDGKVDGWLFNSGQSDGSSVGDVGINQIGDSYIIIVVAAQVRDGHGSVGSSGSGLLVGGVDGLESFWGGTADGDKRGLVIVDEESNDKLFGLISSSISSIVLDDLGLVDVLGTEQHLLEGLVSVGFSLGFLGYTVDLFDEEIGILDGDVVVVVIMCGGNGGIAGGGIEYTFEYVISLLHVLGELSSSSRLVAGITASSGFHKVGCVKSDDGLLGREGTDSEDKK